MDAVPKIQPKAFHLARVNFYPVWCFPLYVPSSIETYDLAEFRPACYARPMIYASRGRDSRCHFCNTCRNHEVEARYSDEFVNDASRPAIVERNDLKQVSGIRWVGAFNVGRQSQHTIEPPNAAQTLPVVIPMAQRLSKLKLRSSSCLCPEAFNTSVTPAASSTSTDAGFSDDNFLSISMLIVGRRATRTV